MKENPVRLGAYWVLRRSRFVSVNLSALENLSEELARHPDPVWVERYHFRGEEEVTLRYLLLLDALNFCFWPPPGFPCRPPARWINLKGEQSPFGTGPCPQKREVFSEKWSFLGPEGEQLTGYYALSYALRRAVEEKPTLLEGKRLANLSAEELWEVLGDIPLLPWRVRAAQEVGRVLLRFRSARDFLAQAGGSAPKLVELVTAHLPMFRDAVVYEGRWVPFYKRAQIFVADVWGAFEGKGPGRFQEMHWLTAFADYKLPQILWAFGALKLHPVLAERIGRKELIPWGSAEEVEIRAATIVAVEELVRLLRDRGRDVLPFQVDWLLWNAAQGALPVPHHRTLTWAY